MKRKISFFICSLHSGGAEHQLTVLANLLAERDYHIKIITFADKPDHYHINPSIKRIKIYHKSKIVNFLCICIYLLKLKTDCFISFGQRENLISLIPFLFKKARYIAGERNNTVGAPTRIEKILVSWLYRRADFVVPNSKSQGEHLVKSKAYLAKKIRVIHNFTDLSLFKVKEYPKNNVTQIGIFCRFEPQKNIKRFAEAVKKLKESCEVPFQIMWYGNQSFANESLHKYFDSFKEQIINDKLENVILLNEPVKNVQDYLPKFDAIALPSLYEGFSNAISEAICCGKPMLVSRVSDNPVMVHEGENGFLFDPTNVEEIVETLKKFLNLSSHERVAMGENSRNIAEKLFNKDIFLDNYLKLIH